MRITLVGMAGLAALMVACNGGVLEQAPISGIEVVADGEFIVGTQVQLRVIATRTDGSQEELTDGIVFTSSDDSIASVDATGLVTVHVGGPVSFIAAAEGFEDVLGERTTCDYPRFAPDIVYGQTMPPLSWPAKWPDGTDFTLNLADVHCDREWRDKIDTLVVVISAAWCDPCKKYMKELAVAADELETHRTQILYVIGQDTDGAVASTGYGYAYMNRTIKEGRIPGIVVGDLNTSPKPGFVQSSSQLMYWPSSFIVRLRDMQVIASGNFTDRLDIAKIADNPEADYSNGNRGSFRNRCGPDDEEKTEPNNLPVQAVPVMAGTYTGGICADSPDLYRVELSGRWELDLRFDASVGDLDVLVWDENTNKPLVVDGQVNGSTGSTGVERFEHAGVTLVGVHGYNHASAPYTLTITEK